MATTLTPAVEAIEAETMRRVGRRLIPLLMVCYFAAYLDRVNVGFAALTMNKALGMSAEIFGIGSGIFFLGYFLFEVPSNLILEKVGARRWIARILITWGIISGATAFVTGTWSFLGIRFLLGLAEAGFYPGIILYLTWWFPSSYRSRIIGIFMTAIPISIVTGSLISSQILRLGDWGGLAGWQWLFILEAIPAIVLGVVVMVYLTDTPETRRSGWTRRSGTGWPGGWPTSAAQKEAIARLLAGRDDAPSAGLAADAGVFRPERVRLRAGDLPAADRQPLRRRRWPERADQRPAVRRRGGRDGVVGLALRTAPNEHRLHTAAACFLNFAGLAVCIFLNDPVLMMVAIILSQMGQSSIAPTFWALPTAMLSGTAAAGGIAMINAVGNLGGFLGPYMMGAIKDATGSFTIGLLSIAMGALVSRPSSCW